MRYRFWVLCLVLTVVCGGRSFAQSSPTRIEIHAHRFSFTPAEITIDKGATVTLALTSDDVPHSLLIEGLHINATITKGHVTEVTLTPMTDGDFKGKCGRFCGSGHGSMLFMVHVVEK
jgi:cytochrome c oxidase subunit 2